MAGRSCVEHLRSIQKSVGLTEKELKDAVREVTEPREVKLPVFHEKTERKERRMRERQQSAGQKYQKLIAAHWYLEVYLKPECAAVIYTKYPKFKDLVSYAYDRVMDLIQLTTYVVEEEVNPLTMFSDEPDDDLDILDVHWKAFNEYCKKHHLHDSGDIFERRKRFKKWMRKKHRRYYSKASLRMYDPIFAMTVVDEKEMIKNMKRITRENEIRVQKFHKMLESLVADKSIGSAAMKKFDKQTDELIQRHRSRLKSFMKDHGQTSTPITFEIDDEPPVVCR